MRWPRVLIAGGSIGGLTAGVLLSELGCDVEIYERSSSALQDRGAGIVVLPVTERYFDHQDASDERVSLELTYWTYVDSDGRQLIADPDHYRFSGWSTIYRALLRSFDRDRYHFGHEAIGFEQDQTGVRLKLRDRPGAEGDLLIFADGFSSTGRSILLPEVRPEYAGYVAWRGTTPESTLSDRAQAELEDSMIYQVLEPGHILVYAIPDPEGRTDPPHRVINFVWYRNYPEGGPLEDLMLDRHGVQRSGTMPPGSIRREHVEEMWATAQSLETKAAEPLPS